MSTFAVLWTATAGGQGQVEIPLSGIDGDGYFATVGFNQEGNQTLAGISPDPTDPKFFDYPAYVNPLNPANIFIMYVEPYRFGLAYPDLLHPTGLNSFESVGELRPLSEAGEAGVTFVEGATEDQDFNDFAIGSILFDAALVTGVGTEVVPPSAIVFTLDGSEFESTNRTEIISGADFPPFGPSGRSNRNEAANSVTLQASGSSGVGLTFQAGLLTSIELVAEADVVSEGVAFAGSGFGFVADGELVFSGREFCFDIDGQSTTPIGSNVRLILNRSGSPDAIGTFVVPGACPADFDGSGTAGAADALAVLSAINNGAAEYTGDGDVDFFDLVRFLRSFDEGCDD
ncbi:MAG: hypothetical protein AAF108_06660 [Planctomycetota bacterium]